MLKQKLLIIDDSEDIHDLVQVWLEDEPLEFTIAHNGEEGLARAREVLPDLVLLDVDLPVLDGFEVCVRLKADPRTADVPVVFLTGASSTEEKLRGLELGATDYVTKPFDPAELRARVRAALHTRRLMDLLAQKALTLQESEERFRILAENSSDIITRQAPDGTFLYVSPACGAILGYAPEEMQGRPSGDFVHPDDVEGLWAHKRSLRAEEQRATAAFRCRRKDGRYIWLESTLRVILDEAGARVREIHGSGRDVSLRKQMEFRENLRAEVLELVAEGRPLLDILRTLTAGAEAQEPAAVAAGVMLSEGVVHHCAPNLPAPIASTIERHLYDLVASHGASAAQSGERVIVRDLLTDPHWEALRPEIVAYGLRNCWSILIRSRQKDAFGVFSLYRRDELLPSPPATDLLKLCGELASVAVDHSHLTEQLTFQAQHDALTELPNRALFADRLQQALAGSARSGRSSAALLIDVDRFKYINDTYGHHAGDEILCQIAHRLRGRLRASDTLARMGGDEFAVILTEMASPDDAHEVAKCLNEEFSQPVEMLGRKQFVTLSIGSAVFPRDAADTTTLIKHADLALYRAKDAGRNTARAFTPDMGEGTVERMELEGALREAARNGELRLHYQPKVDAEGNVVGLEALVRWQHPTLGIVPPAKFIALAEDTGVIVPVGNWVLQEAARQATEWAAKGLPPVPIAVNVSTRQFAQADFVRTVWQTLQASGLSRPWLEIELTESLLMQNIRDAADKLTQLQAMGVSVAIDDFGTGYSSLAYLQRLSLDTLKVDRSFVSSISAPGSPSAGQGKEGRGGSSETIVRAIVALGQSLGLRVIAEGVETAFQRDLLIGMGCDQLQGYLFATPCPPAEVEALLRRDGLGLRSARSA